MADKPLPFDPKKLKGISEKLIVSHHDNNYAGRCAPVGQIQQMLAGLPDNAPGFQVKGLKMEELIATNSAILHEEYFGNLGGDGKASGPIQQAIAAGFGGFDKWEQSFRATSNALGGGSGWAILSFNLRDGSSTTTLRSITQKRRIRPTYSRQRHVRACVPHGLRFKCRNVRRCIHAERELG